MAIISPSIRRSLQRLLVQSSSQNVNAFFFTESVFGRVATSCSRRTIHSTRVLSGDALDMADTFSRRHGKRRVV